MTSTSLASPLFVFGVARSGTNLIAGMLNAHDSVALGLDPLMPVFKELRNATVRESAPDLVAGRFDPQSSFQDYYFNSDGTVLLNTIMSGDMNVEIDVKSRSRVITAIRQRALLESPKLSEQLVDLSGNTFRDVCASVLTRIQGMKPRKKVAWVGVKEVWTVEFIPALAAAFPDARFVVMRRDPRAVITSLMAQTALDPTQGAHAVSYLRHWRKERAVCGELLKVRGMGDRIKLQSYEALARHPEEESVALCQFLEIPYAPSMLHPRTLSGERFNGNSSYGRLSEISMKPTEYWREVITPSTMKAVEFHCGPEMVPVGYELEGEYPDVLNDVVWQFVCEANEKPGSWRSDGLDPKQDTISEQRRWTLLKGPADECSIEEIRRHFLFESSFQMSREATAAKSFATSS